MSMPHPVISADSHITEPAGTYLDHIDAKWRDKAPRMAYHEKLGDVFFIDGMSKPVPMGLVAAAGKPAEEIRVAGVRFEEMHRGGWDPAARLARPGARRRRRRGDLPDRRHGALQPPGLRLQEGLLRRVQPLDRRATAATRRRACSAAGRPPCASPAEGIADLKAIRELGPARRDDARQPGGRGLRLAGLRSPSGRRPSSSACRSRSTS